MHQQRSLIQGRDSTNRYSHGRRATKLYKIITLGDWLGKLFTYPPQVSRNRFFCDSSTYAHNIVCSRMLTRDLFAVYRNQPSCFHSQRCWCCWIMQAQMISGDVSAIVGPLNHSRLVNDLGTVGELNIQKQASKCVTAFYTGWPLRQHGVELALWSI